MHVFYIRSLIFKVTSPVGDHRQSTGGGVRFKSETPPSVLERMTLGLWLAWLDLEVAGSKLAAVLATGRGYDCA